MNVNQVGTSSNINNFSPNEAIIDIELLQRRVNEERQQGPASCMAVADQVLTAYPPEEQQTIGDIAASGTDDDDAADEGFDPEKMFEYLTNEIRSPQPHNIKNRAYTLLASAEKVEQPSWAKEFSIDEQVWSDLNLLSGNKEHPTSFLGEILCRERTHSEIGKAYFNGLLARPVADVELLRSRQRVVQELVTNQQLFVGVDDLLKEFAEHESMFSGMWGKEQLMQFVKAEDYFPRTKAKNWPRATKVLNYASKKGNNSPLALDAKITLQKVTQVYGQLLTVFMVVNALVYALTRLAAEPPAAVNYYTDKAMSASLFGGTLSILLALPYLLKYRVTQSVSAAASSGCQALGIQRSWKQFSTGLKYDDFLRKRIGHIFRCLKMMQRLGELVPAEMEQNLVFFKHINRVFNELPKMNLEFAEIVQLIDAPTFKLDSSESTSLFFRRGRVLYVYRQLEQLKSTFEPLFAAMGEMDAFLTIAKLIKEPQSVKASYCFPEYLHEYTPYVKLDGFWNSFLDPQKVVPNSLAVGLKAKVPNMIVTGPNSAGKSTIVCKGIPLAVIMAQSLGIAPAQQMSLTVFSHIAVYMNVADSLVDKESRFQRECKLVIAHGDRIHALAAHRSFSLAVFDEIFSGTSPEEGTKWGYLTAKGYSNYQNCICLVATHFEQLTALEEDTKGRFVNYKVAIATDNRGEYKRDEQGRLKRTYILERGISSQHIAKEVLQEQGINSPFFRQNFLEKTDDFFLNTAGNLHKAIVPNDDIIL